MSPWHAFMTALALIGLSSSARAAAPAPLSELGPVDVSALATSNERLYVGSFDQGLFVVEHDGRAHAYADPALNPHVNALAWSERDHVLWVGTARGLVRCTEAEGCRRTGTDAGVHALLVSQSGAVIAGGDDGLVFVEADVTRVFGRKQGARFRSVWALAEVGGELFAGTTNGLFFGVPAAFSGRGRTLGRAAIVLGTLPDDWVTALASSDGRLYVGTYSAGVASFRIGSGGLEPEALDASLGYVNPSGLVPLAGGRLAVATMDGLRLGVLGSSVRLPTRTSDVTAISANPAGGFWIATRVGLEGRATLE